MGFTRVERVYKGLWDEIYSSRISGWLYGGVTSAALFMISFSGLSLALQCNPRWMRGTLPLESLKDKTFCSTIYLQNSFTAYILFEVQCSAIFCLMGPYGGGIISGSFTLALRRAYYDGVGREGVWTYDQFRGTRFNVLYSFYFSLKIDRETFIRSWRYLCRNLNWHPSQVMAYGFVFILSYFCLLRAWV